MNSDFCYLGAGLCSSQSRFEINRKGIVAFLGGSITAMEGWRDFVCSDLQQRFPKAEFQFINAGVPSIGSTSGAFRFQRDVLSRGKVDLLFVDASVNDEINGQTPIEQIRGMEGIVRQARLADPGMDIVLLYLADPWKVASINGGDTPEVIQNHQKVAFHYQISSVNLAAEVAEGIRLQRFTWENDFVDLHPSLFGHRIYAECVSSFLSQAWRSIFTTTETRDYTLPDPLDDRSYFRGCLLDVREANADAGWSIDPRWHSRTLTPVREGFFDIPVLISETPESTLILRFYGSGVGLFVLSGPDCGMVEYQIDGGSWHCQDLYTERSSQLHLPWARMLADDLPYESHEIILKVSPKSHAKSLGCSIRIVNFLVNGESVTCFHFFVWF